MRDEEGSFLGGERRADVEHLAALMARRATPAKVGPMRDKARPAPTALRPFRTSGLLLVFKILENRRIDNPQLAVLRLYRPERLELDQASP